MNLGHRLKEARLAAGLSQRQLCGDTITRNMLSQIENGSARPSMDTLRCLAGKLNKPVSYFLEEAPVASPNRQRMLDAKAAFAQGDAAKVLELLEDYQGPDGLFDEERGLLEKLSYMELARQAIRQQRLPYARQLLEKAEEVSTMYPAQELQRQLLLYEAGGEVKLPNMDNMLLVMASAAMAAGNNARAKALLEGAEEKNSDQWRKLMGLSCFAAGEYAAAAQLLASVEEMYPKEVLPKLEICFRELGDYKQAYAYACKQR